MRIAAIILYLLTCFLPLFGVEWFFTPSPNPVSDESISGKYSIGVPVDGKLFWHQASGVSLVNDENGFPVVRKSAGGSCSFILSFAFPYPVKSFRLTTPAISGLDFNAGGCHFEYALGAGGTFKSLLRLDRNHSQYTYNGAISPQVCPEITPGRDNQEKILQLRITFDGYVGNMDFSKGGIIDYALTPDRKAEVALKLHPDISRNGFVYSSDRSLGFNCNSTAVTKVTLTDLGRGIEVNGLELKKWDQLLLGNLPALEPGLYELRFSKNDCEDICQRFAVVPPARILNWSEKQRSPFGIVGISRTGGFRESRAIDGPAIAALIGVHQERTGWGSWVDYNAEKGKLVFPSRHEISTRLLLDGLVYRNNLAWTPNWAVDQERIKKDNYTGWTGHYPPKEEHLADYAAFASAVAEHFKGIGVAEFEMWNEPNCMPYGSFKGTFEEYVKFCETAAKAVHSVNPDAKMILGNTGDADVGFIAHCLKAGLSKHFSLVDIHPYRHTNQGPEDGLLGDINRLKKAIAEYGNNQGIIFSEVGWPTTGIDTGSYGKVTEFQQACFNTRTMLISLAAGVQRVHFHIMEDWGSDKNNPEHNFGFFLVNGTPKAAVPAMAANARHLEKAVFLGRMDTPELQHAWYWKTPWEKDCVLATVWADTQVCPEPGEIILPGEAVQVFDMWGGRVTDGTRVAIKDGKTIVKPDADPIYIYLPADRLPEVGKLPECLRPWLKKRVNAPLTDTRQLPDFQTLRHQFIPGTVIKAMAYAGIENSQIASPLPRNEAHSTFDLCYDDAAIRLSCNVKSGRPPVNNNSGWWLWAGDCIRIYIGCGKRDFFTDKDYQLCLAPVSASGKPSLSVISLLAPSGLPSGAEMPADIKVENYDRGWKITARILWKDLGIKPRKNDVWRFDISCSTGSWNNRIGDCWTNPSHWGEIVFAN